MPNLQQCQNMFDPVGLLEVFFYIFFAQSALEDIERVQKVDDHNAAPHCECGSSPGEAVAEGGTHRRGTALSWWDRCVWSDLVSSWMPGSWGLIPKIYLSIASIYIAIYQLWLQTAMICLRDGRLYVDRWYHGKMHSISSNSHIFRWLKFPSININQN